MLSQIYAYQYFLDPPLRTYSILLSQKFENCYLRIIEIKFENKYKGYPATRQCGGGGCVCIQSSTHFEPLRQKWWNLKINVDSLKIKCQLSLTEVFPVSYKAVVKHTQIYRTSLVGINMKHVTSNHIVNSTTTDQSFIKFPMTGINIQHFSCIQFWFTLAHSIKTPYLQAGLAQTELFMNLDRQCSTINLFITSTVIYLYFRVIL